MERDLLRAVIDPIILSLVAERPLHGYQIVKEVNDRSNGVFRFKEGTLYPCLHRLEAAGWIEGRWEVADTGRTRRYYEITKKGRKVLNEEAGQWKALSTAVNALLLSHV
ncbi:MAG: PadR family transcriptional regulator [Acidobacteria bacterium]|nr:MAG: PadR family transcriptional regulator [Acidobacteriota bacterium]